MFEADTRKFSAEACPWLEKASLKIARFCTRENQGLTCSFPVGASREFSAELHEFGADLAASGEAVGANHPVFRRSPCKTAENREFEPGQQRRFVASRIVLRHFRTCSRTDESTFAFLPRFGTVRRAAGVASGRSSSTRISRAASATWTETTGSSRSRSRGVMWRWQPNNAWDSGRR